MRTCAILLSITLLSVSQILAGAFGEIYGPHEPTLSDSGLTIKTSRWEGLTSFEVSLVPGEEFENDDWFGELVLWKDREESKVEIASKDHQSTKDGISCRFSIDDRRIDDADFRFQSYRDGNPGLYFELDLSAFRSATNDKSTFPNKEE